MSIEKIFAYAKQNNCSDVHLSTGVQPSVRLYGDLTPIANTPVLSEKVVFDMLDSIMSEEQRQGYRKNLEIDFAIQTNSNLRYRVNAFFTTRGPAAAFREIPAAIKNLEELGTPEVVSHFMNFNKGLVLIVGPTGSGKSTTMAAIVDGINSQHPYHIITIEDPVEFVHQSKKSLINQREVGGSTKSFANALKSALREDPDVILVGELRDIETIRLALTAAETGHLVLATLHTSSAAQTINRIIDVFPSEDKAVVRTMLSTSIKAVLSQRLIKKVSGGRCAAYEIMMANPSIRNLIREDKIPQINSIIELNKRSGMMLMKDSIDQLLTNGVISKETAEEILYGE